MEKQATKSDIFIPYRKYKEDVETLVTEKEKEFQKNLDEKLQLINLMKSRSRISAQVQLLQGGQAKVEIDVGENLNVKVGGYDLYSGDELDIGDGRLGISDRIISDGSENKLLIVTTKRQYEIPVNEIERYVNEGLNITTHFNTYRPGDNIAIDRESRMGFVFIAE